MSDLRTIHHPVTWSDAEAAAIVRSVLAARVAPSATADGRWQVAFPFLSDGEEWLRVEVELDRGGNVRLTG